MCVTSIGRLVGQVLFWVLFLFPASAWAEPVDHVVGRFRLDTQDPAYDLARLQQTPAAAFDKILAAGYGKEPVWVRLRVDPGLSAGRRGERLLLRVRPGYLDEVVLFDPASASQPTGITGDRHPLAWQGRPSTVFNLALAPSEVPRDLWVRLTSETTRAAHFEVVRENDLVAMDARTTLWSGVYLACLAIFAFWGGAQLLVRRDGMTMAFLGFQLSSLGYGVCVLGFVRLLGDGVVSAETVNLTTGLMVLVAVFSSLTFSTVLLREMRAPPWGLCAMVLVLLAYPLLMILLLAGWASAALRINMIIILLAPLLAFVVACFSQGGIGGVLRVDSPSERWLGLGYFTTSMLLTLAAAMPGLGLIEGTEINLHIIMLHGIASGFLMLAMLLYRIYRLLQQRELLAAEAEFSRRRIQQEQAFSRDRERLLAMLAHELKTPLATIRMLLGTLGLNTKGLGSAQSAVQDMNNVIERCLQVGQLDEGALKIHRQRCDLGAIARRAVAAVSEQNRVRLDLSPQLPSIDSDPQLLEIVLRNLLDNAIKYSPAGSVVELLVSPAKTSLSRAAVSVRNEVGNTGKPDPDKVFSKYYRHRQAQRRTGSGLGLYLVHGLVTNLGGQLTYHDEGERVSFRADFP